MLRRLRLSSLLSRARFPLLLAVVACSPDPALETGDAPQAEWSYEREFPGSEHPASLVLRLSATEIGLAQQLVLEQELRVQRGFAAEFPEYLPEDFEGFSVVSIDSGSHLSGATSAVAGAQAASTDDPDPDGRPHRRKRLLLEPDRSGELTIAALAVYFHAEGSAEEAHFLTDEITVKVEAVEDIAELATRPLRGIYEAPLTEQHTLTGWWLALGLGGLVALGVIARKIIRRERKGPPAIPAHEVAYESLRRLVALNLVEKGEVELFFIHLSGILRTYIEDRFEVHAPERTTEEFLAEATKHPALQMHRERLGEFLKLSDQVKFARYEPDEQHIQGAFDTLKQFIEETRQTELALAA